MNGRRKLRAEIEARYRWIKIDPTDSVRFHTIGSRRDRRSFARSKGLPFRPIYGHAPASRPEA